MYLTKPNIMAESQSKRFKTSHEYSWANWFRQSRNFTQFDLFFRGRGIMRNWGTFPPRNNDKDYKSTQSVLTDTLRVKYFSLQKWVLELVLEIAHFSWMCTLGTSEHTLISVILKIAGKNRGNISSEYHTINFWSTDGRRYHTINSIGYRRSFECWENPKARIWKVL